MLLLESKINYCYPELSTKKGINDHTEIIVEKNLQTLVKQVKGHNSYSISQANNHVQNFRAVNISVIIYYLFD